MPKSAGKSARKSKTTATRDLSASGAKARNVKGGSVLSSIGKAIGSTVKGIAK